MVELRLNVLSEKVIGGAIAVHRFLGAGFVESTYAKALATELRHLGMHIEIEKPVELFYRGQSIGQGRLDMLVNRELILELKAVRALADAHTTQILNYLRATGLTLGLIINFHEPRLVEGIRRIAN